ncbi:Antibiotic biosynthesis monooxygenase [Seminavis robusta]|uniref:Antibiotic biosynthesis monooxygenase n=1 Tax=Seminavis robusta TaxID=568900 RepID=A0A9N8DQ59_9STRA|nr:Antibiotic biosynthesis monooxygenase [Seminavis robusta]|eukprot:Sro273_g105070.1 Antibiotic biosynthesis monooxygenase (354) ;mRNA; f:19575-20636
MKVPSVHVCILALVATLCSFSSVQSFTSHHSIRPYGTTSLKASTANSDATTTTEGDKTSSGLLKRDRYVATNRFAVRQGKAAKFEKRWATRKSKLATLDGFKYFHLMRRVTLNNDDGSNVYDEGDGDDTAHGNYVSFTIWSKKSHFSAWRSGEAFKEAHGGTSIGAFVSTMVKSAMVLRGAPRPAFYDGLLIQSTIPDSQGEVVDGWRNVNADGVNTLPTECFVACNQFFVPPENAAAFEQRWKNRESKLQECDGFVAFTMMRRDASAKGHGVVPLSSGEPSYTSCTIWRDRAAFDNWRKGSAFQKVHGGGDANSKKSEEEAKPATPPQPLWSQPPQPVFYEGTLVITGEDGA